jgi:hypothetical protein
VIDVRADKALSDWLAKKYQTWDGPMYTLNLKDVRGVRVDARIDEKCRNLLEGLCVVFLETFRQYELPAKPIPLDIFLEEELKKKQEELKKGLRRFGLCDKNRGHIWLDLDLLPISASLAYQFLHELAHCWSRACEGEREPVEIELCADLIAFGVLSRLEGWPLKEKVYEGVCSISYLGGPVGHAYLGEEQRDDVLRNPEEILKQLAECIRAKGT